MSTNKAFNKILIWNSKGGVGKTPIAYNMALDHGHSIGTNEGYYCYESLDSIPEETMIAVPMEERFPEFPEDVKIIYDLAGSISQGSHSISSAIEHCDLAIVPIRNEWKSLENGVNSIHQIRQFNKPILVVATQLKKESKDIFPMDEWTQSIHFKAIAEAVHIGNSPDIPVLPLKYSAAFDTIFAMERSIKQISAEDKTRAYSWRCVNHQMNAIYDFIDSMKVQDTKPIVSAVAMQHTVSNESTMRAH